MDDCKSIISVWKPLSDRVCPLYCAFLSYKHHIRPLHFVEGQRRSGADYATQPYPRRFDILCELKCDCTLSCRYRFAYSDALLCEEINLAFGGPPHCVALCHHNDSRNRLCSKPPVLCSTGFALCHCTELSLRIFSVRAQMKFLYGSLTFQLYHLEKRKFK